MTAAAILLAAAALLSALRIVAARARAPRLPPAPPAAGSVLALLPVRDEEENVEACLHSLLAQTAQLRVRVLDDSSHDRTRALAEEVARHDERVEVRDVPVPQAGLNGKVHALAHGSQGATEDWIVAIDADARLAPTALARALAAADRHGLAAVSLAARQRARGIGEAMLTPAVFALLDSFVEDWGHAALGRGTPVANGQFLLVRRHALRAIGGYASIGREPLDDVALARRLAENGEPLGFWRAGPLLEVRMYRGGRATFRGWRRNLGLILEQAPGRAASWAAAALLPALLATAALATGAPAAALIAWCGGAAGSILLRLDSGSAPLWGLLYPLDGLTLTACLATVAVDRSRGARPRWRGRPLAGDDQPPSGAA